MVDEPDSRPLRFTVLGAAGDGADELRGEVIEEAAIAPAGEGLADQRLLHWDATGEAGPGDGPSSGPGQPCPFRDGEVLLTSVSVEDTVRGVLIVESPEPIPDELPNAIRALTTQVSLAISRADLQERAIEIQSSERFEALIQASSDVITIAAVDGHVRFQSPSVRQVFGYEANDILGRDLLGLVHPDDVEQMRFTFRRVAADPTIAPVCECRIRHADGSWRDTETRISNLLHVPAIAGIVLNTRDITERHALEAELRHQAFHDSLTGPGQPGPVHQPRRARAPPGQAPQHHDGRPVLRHGRLQPPQRQPRLQRGRDGAPDGGRPAADLRPGRGHRRAVEQRRVRPAPRPAHFGGRRHPGDGTDHERAAPADTAARRAGRAPAAHRHRGFDRRRRNRRGPAPQRRRGHAPGARQRGRVRALRPGDARRGDPAHRGRVGAPGGDRGVAVHRSTTSPRSTSTPAG